MLIAHFSDTHIQTGPLAAEPARPFHRALGRVLALDRRPDCVVITGDIANSGSDAEYDAFRQILGAFPIPVHLTTGNHDDPKVMVAQFQGTGFLGGGDSPYYTVEYPDALLIVLDTNIPGSPAGHLGASQLQWLDDALAKATKPVVLALHHPPASIGMQYLDDMGLGNRDELRAVLEGHRRVHRILAGHIHRTIIGSFAGATMAIAPSLYRQAALVLTGDKPMGYVHEPPGVLLHLGTGEDWLTHYLPSDMDGASVGYF